MTSFDDSAPASLRPAVPPTSMRERRADSDYRSLDRQAFRYAVRRTWHGFILHRGLDSAAGLTFFTALAVFPATLAVVSIVGLLDPSGDAVKVILSIIDAFAPKSTLDSTRLALEQFARMPDPVITLVAGLALTIWTGASYATAFGRTVNAIYEVQEGRRFIKLRLLMMVESVALIVLLFIIAVIVIITPDVARAVTKTLALPPVAADLWIWLKWPLLALLSVFTVVVLYYGTPNLKRPRIRWLSIGATFTIAAWTLATTGFALYIWGFAQYDRFYGLLSGAIIALLWLFLSNLVLVIGVEVDAEATRARQLLRGQAAEESIHLPLRDTYRNRILARRRDRDLTEGRAIRQRASELLERDRPPANE